MNLFKKIEQIALSTKTTRVYVEGKANYQGGHIDEYINKPIKLQNNIVYIRKEPSGNKYERHADVWYVKGHYRNYKNGNQVFIQPHLKGPNKNMDYSRQYLIGK